MRISSFEELKATGILALVGGAAGALAFFLPWYVFFDGISLLSIGTFSQNPAFTTGAAVVPSLAWIELIAAVLLIVSPLLASSLGKTANILNLVGAALGLVFVLYACFSLVIAFSGASTPPPGADPAFLQALKASGVQLSGSVAPIFLGAGFWLAAAGFIMALVAAIKALTGPAKPGWVTTQPDEPEIISAAGARQ